MMSDSNTDIASELRKVRPDMTSAEVVFDCLQALPDDFMRDGREDGTPQEREDF